MVSGETNVSGRVLRFFAAALIACTVVAGWAEDPKWTWMAGIPEYDATGVAGVQGLSASENTPIGRRDAGTWTDHEGNLWLYGGFGYKDEPTLGARNDLWKYTVATGEWTWVGGHPGNVISEPAIYGTKGQFDPSNWPGSRCYFATWTGTDGRLWLFGGSARQPGGAPAQLLNDLWVYDIPSGQWMWAGGSNTFNEPAVFGTKGVADPANIPGARTTKSTWTDDEGNLWLFGGSAVILAEFPFGSPVNDLWKYNPASGAWTWVKGPAPRSVPVTVYGTKGIEAPDNTPGGRDGAVVWKDPKGYFWLYGGDTVHEAFPETSSYSSGLANDVWKLNPATGNWAWMEGTGTIDERGASVGKGIADESNSPGSRHQSTGAADDHGNLWMFGGIGFGVGTNGIFNDLWKYDISSGQWTWVRGSLSNVQYGVYGKKKVEHTDFEPESTPGSRAGAMAWSGQNGSVWFMGGQGNGASSVGLLSDLWNVDVPPATDLPDLTGHWFVGKGNCKDTKTGTKCKFKQVFIVRNEGAADAGRFLTRFYLSHDERVSTDDVELKPKRIKKLKAGKDHHLKVRAKVDDQTPRNYLIAVIDDPAAVNEIDETNNVDTVRPPI